MVDVALLALIAVGLAGLTLGRVLPALGHPVFVVAGPSMTPAIGVGAAVVLETVPSGALRVGDVVSLRSGAGRAVFTHRIVRIADRDGELWLETAGDANEAADPSLTPASAVIGRVAVVLPVAGYALTVLSSPPGVLFVLSTGALLLLLGWTLESVARDRRRLAGPVVAVPAVRLAPPVLVPEAPAVARDARARRSAAGAKRSMTRPGPRPSARPGSRPAPGMRRA